MRSRRATRRRSKPVPQIAGRGTLILEGGGNYLDEASETDRRLAGTETRALPDRSRMPRAAAIAYHKFDGIGGFKMLTVNLTANSAQQARVLEALESCTGYFFNGGDPDLLSSALRPQRRGQQRAQDHPPALRAERRRRRRHRRRGP